MFYYGKEKTKHKLVFPLKIVSNILVRKKSCNKSEKAVEKTKVNKFNSIHF